MNDLHLTELLFKIRSDADTLNYFSREKKHGKLFDALNRIHADSRSAMHRLNELADKERHEQGDKSAAS